MTRRPDLVTGRRPLAVRHQRRHLVRRDPATGEPGYVLVLFALVLVPLLLIVGLAVDVGSWYNRVSDIQKAADAAALAGVVWLPDEEKAAEVALEAAKRNGFDPVDPNISVVVEKSAQSDTRLRVGIRDDRVGSFFYSNLGGSNINLERTSFAEYVMPVKMGSPENKLGNDPTAPGYPTNAPNLWASISGPQAPYENGDPYSTKLGPDGGVNPEYRDWGYVYVVDVPASSAGRTLEVLVYDAGNYPRGSFPNVETADYGAVNTQFEFYRPDSTPMIARDGLTPDYSMAGRCTSGGPGRFRLPNNEIATRDTYRNRWVRLCRVTVPAGGTGQWMMQVKSSAIPGIADSGAGFNQFSVRATLSGAGPQPALYTIGDLSLFNNLPGRTGNVDANFYLAEIDQVHAGKTLEVSLFDPGDGTGSEGAYYANIRGPANSIVPCRFRERGSPSWNNLANCRINTRSGGVNQYNEKWLDIQLPLAPTYSCTDCWWTVLYQFQDIESSPYDRTVWSAKVIGDPVHLVEED